MFFKRDYRPQKGQCFVLMPFGVKEVAGGGRAIDWDERYQKVLDPAIRAADMVPSRADDIFGTQPLIDRVWRGIQEAEIIVAELTGRSPNVMYEIGLAHLIGKRFVLLTMNERDVPSDLSHFVQIRYDDDGLGLLELTRNLEANLKAARTDTLHEAMLLPLIGAEAETVPATVESVSPAYVTVRSANGRMGFLYPEDVTYSRHLNDLQRHFRTGQALKGTFVYDIDGDSRYSLVAHQDNPWPKLVTERPEGSVFAGQVCAAPLNVGAFVAMGGDINGLIPRSDLVSLGQSLQPGDEVEAEVVRIDQARRRVVLRFRRLLRRPTVDGEWSVYQVGKVFTGSVRRVVSERGFMLVALPPGKTGLLNINRMSAELRGRFNAGEVVVDSALDVEIVEVQPQRDRLILTDTDPAG